METLIIYGINRFRKDNGNLIVDQNIDISGRNLVKIPFNVHTVNGHFDVRGNQVISTKDFPRIINGNLVASNCEIVSLENFPEVSGRIFLDGNYIRNLSGISNAVNFLSISRNPIETLVHAPIIKNYSDSSFLCDSTKIDPVEIKIYRMCQAHKVWNPAISVFENMELLHDNNIKNLYIKTISARYL